MRGGRRRSNVVQQLSSLKVMLWLRSSTRPTWSPPPTRMGRRPMALDQLLAHGLCFTAAGHGAIG